MSANPTPYNPYALRNGPMFHLPDPDYQPEFYDAVTSKRLIAWVIDTLLVCVICALIVPLTGFVALFFWPLLFAVVNFLYRVATLSHGSATWGMRFAAIEFRTSKGTLFDGRSAILHTAGYTLSLALPVLQAVSVVMMLISPRGQGLTDTVMGTVALNRRAVG